MGDKEGCGKMMAIIMGLMMCAAGGEAGRIEKTRGRGRWLGVEMKGNSSRAAAEPEQSSGRSKRGFTLV